MSFCFRKRDFGCVSLDFYDIQLQRDVHLNIRLGL